MTVIEMPPRSDHFSIPRSSPSRLCSTRAPCGRADDRKHPKYASSQIKLHLKHWFPAAVDFLNCCNKMCSHCSVSFCWKYSRWFGSFCWIAIFIFNGKNYGLVFASHKMHWCKMFQRSKDVRLRRWFHGRGRRLWSGVLWGFKQVSYTTV